MPEPGAHKARPYIVSPVFVAPVGLQIYLNCYNVHCINWMNNMSVGHMIACVFLISATVGSASTAIAMAEEKGEALDARDSAFKAIMNAPCWDYHDFEAGKDRELLSQLLKLNSFSNDDLRSLVSNLMQAQDKTPIRNTWFKVLIINRLVFEIPRDATWREIPSVLRGFSLPPGIESATWPLLFLEENTVRISSRSAGYAGPNYQGLKEFDEFAKKYGRRDLTKLTISSKVKAGSTDWLMLIAE